MIHIGCDPKRIKKCFQSDVANLGKDDFQLPWMNRYFPFLDILNLSSLSYVFMSERMPILTEQPNTSNYLERRGCKDSLGFIRLTLKCLITVMKYMPFLDQMSYSSRHVGSSNREF